MDDREFFDNIAPDWDNNEILSTPDKVNHILDSYNINEGDHILDLGTGTGVLLPYLAERVGSKGKLVAVDFSEGMLHQAIKKYQNIIPQPLFINIDFENENIEGEFDKIILYCVYPHLHAPIETLRWLRHVNLKNQGEIFISFPCSEDFINAIHKEKHSESDNLPSASTLSQYLKRNGINAEVIEENESAYTVRIKK